MKLWKITHHHCRALPGATVHLLPCAIKPAETDAARQLQIDLAEDESICIEDTGYHVVSPDANPKREARSETVTCTSNN